MYDAEEIIHKRRKKGKMEYLVKWKGYSSSANTWEPKKNLFDPRLIQQFLAKMKEKPKPPPEGKKRDRKSTSKEQQKQ